MKGFAGIEIPYLSSLDEWPFISTLLVLWDLREYGQSHPTIRYQKGNLIGQ